MDDLKEMLDLANNGDMMAQEKVGIAYLNGKSVEKDILKALVYFEKAAAQGSSIGYYQIGKAYEKGNGRETNLGKAIAYYQDSAERGDVNAQNVLRQLAVKRDPIEQTEMALGNKSVTQRGYAGEDFSSDTVPCYDGTVLGNQKSKTVAAMLAFFLGYIGLHNFYLGFTAKGIFQFILTITVLGAPVSAIWALMDFIMILTGTISCDEKGIELK